MGVMSVTLPPPGAMAQVRYLAHGLPCRRGHVRGSDLGCLHDSFGWILVRPITSECHATPNWPHLLLQCSSTFTVRRGLALPIHRSAWNAMILPVSACPCAGLHFQGIPSLQLSGRKLWYLVGSAMVILCFLGVFTVDPFSFSPALSVIYFVTCASLFNVSATSRMEGAGCPADKKRLGTSR